MKYTLFDGISVGIAGMIGGGIFLLNGVVVKNNRKFAPLSWFYGFIICFFIVFSYIILSIEFPNKYGTILYPKLLMKNNSSKIISGLIIYLGYLVLISVYSVSLSNYVSEYMNIINYKTLISFLCILVSIIISYLPDNSFMKLLNNLVIIKVLIFILIIFIGILTPFKINKNTNLKLKYNKGNISKISQFSILLFGFKIFLSYEGFEMISNMSENMKNLERNIPLSYILSTTIVALVYIGLSYVTNKHIGNELNETNQYSSIINLTKKYGTRFVSPIIIVLLCIIANISAINASMFTNDLIIENYFEQLSLPNKIKDFFNKDINLPFFEKSKKIYVWFGFIISSMLILLPEKTIINLGSLLFLISFGIIGYVGYLLINRKESKDDPVLILNKKIPYSICKIISIISIIICIIGGIILIVNIRK